MASLAAVALLLGATPAAAGMFDIAYSGAGGPSVDVQITFNDSTDVISQVVENPNAAPGSSLAGSYTLLNAGTFAGNDNMVIPAQSAANPSVVPRLTRAGVSFSVADGPANDQTVYSINLSEISLSDGTYVLEVSSENTVSNGATTPLGRPVFATQSFNAPNAVPGFGLANLAVLLFFAALGVKRRLGGVR